MASKKRAKEQARSAMPYVRRLLEDEYVRDQLRSAAGGLLAIYGRAKGQGTQAAEDKRVYRNLRRAATSIRRATVALERPKPKGRARKLATVALIGVGGALLVIKRPKREPEGVAGLSESAVDGGGHLETGDGSFAPMPEPESLISRGGSSEKRAISTPARSVRASSAISPDPASIALRALSAR